MPRPPTSPATPQGRRPRRPPAPSAAPHTPPTQASARPAEPTSPAPRRPQRGPAQRHTTQWCSPRPTPQTAPAGRGVPARRRLDRRRRQRPPHAARRGHERSTPATPAAEGRIVDGYCDHCGTPPPDPRDHFVESPAAWVGGVCDIGKRHARNEDAMALSADRAGGRRARCSSSATASRWRPTRTSPRSPRPRPRGRCSTSPSPAGSGTPDAWAAGGRAGADARRGPRPTTAVGPPSRPRSPNPPSCTFAAAVVEDGVIVAGNVGDSRVYWLPDAGDEPAAPARRRTTPTPRSRCAPACRARRPRPARTRTRSPAGSARTRPTTSRPT